MKSFNGFEDAQKSARYTGGAKLPKGAYVAKIMNVRYEKGENNTSDRILVQFDIVEGEHKDFFKKAYEANPVPFIYVTNNNSATVKDGRLADVAPSILHIMGLEQPSDMTGENLITD